MSVLFIILFRRFVKQQKAPPPQASTRRRVGCAPPRAGCVCVRLSYKCEERFDSLFPEVCHASLLASGGGASSSPRVAFDRGMATKLGACRSLLPTHILAQHKAARGPNLTTHALNSSFQFIHKHLTFRNIEMKNQMLFSRFFDIYMNYSAYVIVIHIDEILTNICNPI